MERTKTTFSEKARNGEVAERVEVEDGDAALLLPSVLTCERYFQHPLSISTLIYNYYHFLISLFFFLFSENKFLPYSLNYKVSK